MCLLRLALSAVLFDDRGLLALMLCARAALLAGRVAAAFMIAVHAIVPRRETWLVTAAFPLFVTAGHGQNIFTAALLGGFPHC